MKIAQKLGLMVGSLLVAMTVLIAGLALQTVHVIHGYNGLLSHQVAQGAEARDMQTSLQTELLTFKDLLAQTDPVIARTDLAAALSEDAAVVALSKKLLAQSKDRRLRTSLEQFQSTYAAIGIIYKSAYESLVTKHATSQQVNVEVQGQNAFAQDLITIVVKQAQASLDKSVAAQQHSVNRNLTIIIAAGLVLVLVMAGLVTLAVRSIVRPVRSLTATALDAANNRLPAVVAEIATLPASAPTPTLPQFEVTTQDELAELATALTTLQDSAVQLALEQRRNEEANAETLVNLGRRNQSLLTRMLSYVTELERDERDPDTLDKLFRLDHLTTRIRRNAESLLVMAGAKQTRTWSQPIAMDDVLRAALSEIEEYTRVSIHHMDPARVHGSVAADLTHMLAELLENGTRFSPRPSQVLVVGRLTHNGYQFDLIDEGLGMAPDDLQLANQRIAEAGQRRPDTKVLGHHVVGRIAARRGMYVHLMPSYEVGLTAQVLVPTALLSNTPVSVTLPEVSVTSLNNPRPAAQRVLTQAPPSSPSRDPWASSSRTPAISAYSRRPEPEPQPEPVPWSGWMNDQADRAAAAAAAVAEAAAADQRGASRRVRGSQLGQLAEINQPPASAPGDGDHIRAQMAALQSGIAAARREQAMREAAEGAWAPEAPAAPTPRRVRGAQLAGLDLQADANDGPMTRDPAVTARQLSGLQAARKQAERETGYHHGIDSPGREG